MTSIICLHSLMPPSICIVVDYHLLVLVEEHRNREPAVILRTERQCDYSRRYAPTICILEGRHIHPWPNASSFDTVRLPLPPKGTTIICMSVLITHRIFLLSVSEFLSSGSENCCTEICQKFFGQVATEVWRHWSTLSLSYSAIVVGLANVH